MPDVHGLDPAVQQARQRDDGRRERRAAVGQGRARVRQHPEARGEVPGGLPQRGIDGRRDREGRRRRHGAAAGECLAPRHGSTRTGVPRGRRGESTSRRGMPPAAAWPPALPGPADRQTRAPRPRRPGPGRARQGRSGRRGRMPRGRGSPIRRRPRRVRAAARAARSPRRTPRRSARGSQTPAEPSHASRRVTEADRARWP